MISMRKWFKKPKVYDVQVYGKLPFYKDYITVVNLNESVEWRDWMLNVFNDKDAIIPEGLWGFLFQHTGNSAPVAGIIEQSSDGIREFPFSLFAVLEKMRLKDKDIWISINHIIENMNNVRSSLKNVNKIEVCYQKLAGQCVTIDEDSINIRTAENDQTDDLISLLPENDSKWPIFFIIPELIGNVKMVSDSHTSGTEMMEKWKQLQNKC